MAKLPDSIKTGVSGFRGIYPSPLSPELVLKLSKAIGTFFKGGKIVFGSDTRLTRSVLGAAVMSGLNVCGCAVIDLGIVPTPTVEVNVLKHNASAGIILSASHNPAEWNALKIVGNDGCFLPIESIRKIISIFNSERFLNKPYNKAGLITKFPEGIEVHIDNILLNRFSKKYIDLKRIASRKFNIYVDAINGTGIFAIPPFFERLKIRNFKVLNNDPDIEFAHIPEPTEANLKSTLKFLKNKKFDICFILDPDADRLAVIDEKGRYISEEFTQALSAYSFLEYRRGPVVTNLSSSLLIDYAAKKFHVPIYRSPVGEANVVALMKMVKAVIGGEGNGGVILPAAHYGRDSLAGILLILDLMARKKKKVSELVAEFPEYYIEKTKVYSSTGFIDIQGIREIFPDAQLNESDGIKVIFPDSWVHIRASATEPVIRIISEAGSKKDARRLIEKVIKIIK